MNVALAHDYLTQRGGAERVVLSLLRAFAGAPLYTSLYDADGTFPEFRDADVHTLPIDRVPLLRRNHRLALPLLAPSWSRLHVDADVLVCSSSGWAHGARTHGRKIVYCHTPARWLYKRERYATGGGLALAVLGGPLRAWDRSSARDADLYLANSTFTRDAIRDAYGIDAQVVHPPPALGPNGETQPVPGVEAGFVLCVARLLAYKNVDCVVDAFRSLADERLVVAGDGPELQRLRASAPPNVTFVGRVSDEQLRWLYEGARGLVAAAFEDFGLTPLEAAAFGVPTAALQYGGFLDTVVDGETGVLFDAPSAASVGSAVRRLLSEAWSEERLRAHAARFDENRFVAEVRQIAVNRSN